MARQLKPALIVLDITTPGGGGFEAFRRLQMMSTTSQIPILVYTSLAYEQAEVPGFLAELSEEFQKGVGGQVAALRDAFRDGNTQALTFAAHSLRGCCGTIGANGMAALARSLEHAPPADPATGWPLIQRLEAEYEAVRRVLEQYVPGAATAHAHAEDTAA